jgi:hypothetical protein
MDENSNPEWKQMLRGSSSGRKALEYIDGLEQQLAEAQAENQRLRNELSDLYVRVPLDEGGNTDTPVQFVGVYVTRWGSAQPTDAFVEWEDRQGEG